MIAMSGGVDSSVAAALVASGRGAESCVGVAMRLYCLHGLTQDDLAFVRFPLGELTKTEVRSIARSRGLPNADKPESMEVCFVQGGLPEFLESHGVAAAHGEIVSMDGKVLGEHE